MENVEIIVSLAVFAIAVAAVIIPVLIMVIKSRNDKKQGSSFNLENHHLICPVCGRDEFYNRQTLMNTGWSSFFNFDWLNKAAQNYVCKHCGYVFWFLK